MQTSDRSIKDIRVEHMRKSVAKVLDGHSPWTVDERPVLQFADLPAVVVDDEDRARLHCRRRSVRGRQTADENETVRQDRQGPRQACIA